ncbi:ISAs1 family transposase, partial [Lacimicrobium alkaliphilum]|uniref:ISAs1 family transposase n=2 Tax=Lacimicrobium alkaliphilum TaxID=1526571 RepID=UPI00166534B9
DPRSDTNKQHNLVDVVFLVLSAVLSGADGWKAIQDFGDLQLAWLRQYRPFTKGIPRRHCIANIIKALDSQLLLQAVFGWINERREQEGKPVIAMDGKTMRGAWSGDVTKALHVISAFDVGRGIALYQECTDSKGKEVEVARQIIDALALDGAIVTLDALHCQTETMSGIAKGKGDFVIQLKGNQPGLLEHVQSCFAEHYDDARLDTYEQGNQGHGRSEQRTIMRLEADLPKALRKKWPHIHTVIEVVSERTTEQGTSYVSRWYVSSLRDTSAEELAGIIRGHWAIENNLHWVLDVAFREDSLKVSDPTGAKHLALFNRAGLSIIKQHRGKKDSIAAKRRGASWSGEFRAELLFG